MGEFREGEGDPTREEWAKHPVSMRVQRISALADLSMRLRAFAFGGVRANTLLNDSDSVYSLVHETKKDEKYAPIPGGKCNNVLDRYLAFALAENCAEDGESKERPLRSDAEALLKDLATMIDAEYAMACTQASTATEEDIYETDMLLLRDVVALARRELRDLTRDIGEDWANYSAWKLEVPRQRLVTMGLAYERIHPEAKGETAKTVAPWFALQDLLLKSHDFDKAEAQKYITECDALVDLIEEREE